MGLYERLIGGAEVRDKIGFDPLRALLAELGRGKVTLDDAVRILGLSAAERAELVAVRNRMLTDVTLTPDVVYQIGVLAEAGLLYNTPAQMKARFGVT
jgi:hypothetical protein